jgi:hypothetical protein
VIAQAKPAQGFLPVKAKTKALVHGVEIVEREVIEVLASLADGVRYEARGEETDLVVEPCLRQREPVFERMENRELLFGARGGIIVGTLPLQVVRKRA